MVSEDVPDIEVLLAQLVSRPAWHARQIAEGRTQTRSFRSGAVIALAYCEHSPVRSECSASALAVASTTGAWGKTTGRGRHGPGAQRGMKILQPTLQPDSR